MNFNLENMTFTQDFNTILNQEISTYEAAVQE